MKPYEAISALAGSGKTYQLTSRFIGLLSLDAKPEEILAITFTRKAAGEIFDRIVQRLAAACLREKDRKELEASLRAFHGNDRFQLPPDAPARWLQTVLNAMPRLHISTIDSLFVNIVQAFALELGLPPRQEILQGGTFDAAREEALRAALESARRDQQARKGFLEAFKNATSDEDKSVRDVVLQLAQQTHTLYLEHPDEQAWGAPARIWPEPPWWDGVGNMDLAALRERTGAFLARYVEPLADKSHAKAWTRFLERLLEGDFSDALGSKLAEGLLNQLDTLLRDGAASFDYNRKPVRLSGRDAQDVIGFLGYIARTEFTRGLREAAGCYRLMSAYEAAYENAVRSNGRLSFGDVQVVLSRARENGVKMDIDYRLDGQFNHWMLDEFQDTSTRQWSVIGNLADEILQSDAGRRTFFYVGDVKQAIYGWRGGDSTLFEAVQGYYRELFGDEPGVLATSWRSSPVILTAVNRVFGGNLDKPLGEFGEVVRRWRKNWQEHHHAPKNEKLPGRVELYALDKPGKDDRPDIARPIEMTCRIVEDLRRRKVPSIAVLVRINSFGDRIADALRARGVDVRRETNPSLMDNGVISALLSMLQLADHPGDEFALKHLKMTPLFDVLQDWSARGDLPAAVRQAAAAKGIAGLLGDLLDLCRARGLLSDPFVEIRARQLTDAAMEFDRLSQGGPSDFARHARSLEVKDPTPAGGVVVMTVHKAKGLEFDAVILPDLQGSRREFTHLERGELVPFSAHPAGKRPGNNPADPEPDPHGFVFPLPGEHIARLDHVLSHARVHARNNRVYEELCLLYVAMTRARQALYLVTEEPAKDGHSLHASTILQQTLGGAESQPLPPDGPPGQLVYSDGAPDWHNPASPSAGPGPALPTAEPFAPGIKAGASAGRRLIVTTPSGEETPQRRDASVLFSAGTRSGSSRGNALHELFEQIEWFEEGIGERVLAAWNPSPLALAPELRDEVRDEFLAALATPGIRDILSRPAGAAEVWREQAFELADQGKWITGRMDRVMVERDTKGRPVRATVIDFKSDRVSSDEELGEHVAMYRPQLAWYLKALSRLLGLPGNRLRAALVFTHARRTVIETPSAAEN